MEDETEPEPTSESETAYLLASPANAERLREAVADVAAGAPFEEVPTLDEVAREPEFNPLQTWDAMVAEFGDPRGHLGPCRCHTTEVDRPEPGDSDYEEENETR